MKNDKVKKYFIQIYVDFVESDFFDTAPATALKTYIFMVYTAFFKQKIKTLNEGYKVNEGEFVASKQKLARHLGTNNKTLNTHIIQLVDAGLLIVTPINNKSWLFTLTDYVGEKVLIHRTDMITDHSTDKDTVSNTDKDTVPVTHYRNKESDTEINNTSTYDDEEYEEVIIDGVVKYKDKDGEIWDV